MEFTKTNVATLRCPPSKSEAFFWDDGLPGFGVRCYPDRKDPAAPGRRVWVCQYRSPDGKTRRMGLGDLRVVSLLVAKGKANEHLEKAKVGGDPRGADLERIATERRRLAAEEAETEAAAAQQKAYDEALTVGDLAKLYVDACTNGRKRKVAPSTLKFLTRVVNVQAKSLHSMKLEAVDRGKLVEMLEGIAVGTDDRKGAPIAANRARAHLSAMFAWGKRTGRMVAENPVANTEALAEETSRERVLTDSELTLIWQCTTRGTDYERIVRLLMLAAARRDEVGAMCWSELAAGDDGMRLWTLPSTRTKNSRPHELPLLPFALAQLPAQREGRARVFGRGKETGFSGWSKGKAALDAAMSVKLAVDFEKREGRAPDAGQASLVPWRMHDLRRTFVTWASENGTEPHIVEAVLNHSSGTARKGVAGVYNRAAYRPQKRDVLERWSRHVAELVNIAGNNHIIPL